MQLNYGIAGQPNVTVTLIATDDEVKQHTRDDGSIAMQSVHKGNIKRIGAHVLEVPIHPKG